MPASPRAYGVLGRKIQAAPDRATQDVLLDRWLAYRDLATEWDAAQWAFDPDKWMEEDRAQMNARPPLRWSRRSIVSLVCCADKADGCLCQANPVCGGVHIFEAGCPAHGTRGEAQFKSTIHEAGEKRTVIVLGTSRGSSGRLI